MVTSAVRYFLFQTARARTHTHTHTEVVTLVFKIAIYIYIYTYFSLWFHAQVDFNNKKTLINTHERIVTHDICHQTNGSPKINFRN